MRIFSSLKCKLDRVSDYGTLYVGRHDIRGGGSDGAEGFSVLSQSRHPQFNGEVCCGQTQGNWFYGVVNDFMLLKLSGQSAETVISLNSNRAVPVNDENLHVIGMGDMHPGGDFIAADRLREVTVNYMPNRECIGASVYPANLIGESSLCAIDHREDACSGDSGGPLIKKGRSDLHDVQVGVVSWYVFLAMDTLSSIFRTSLIKF
jgi:hypothetical protein